MATVNLGAIKFNWKGAYNNSTAYAVDDVVSSGGSSYICILASQGNAVSNGTYWNVMSQAGTDGTNVATTLTTQGDILYRDGSGLQRLPKGAAGQVLKMNAAANAPEYGTLASDFVKIATQSLDATGLAAVEFQNCFSAANDAIYGGYLIHAYMQNNGATNGLDVYFMSGTNTEINGANAYQHAGVEGYRQTNQSGNNLSGTNDGDGRSNMNWDNWGQCNGDNYTEGSYVVANIQGRVYQNDTNRSCIINASLRDNSNPDYIVGKYTAYRLNDNSNVTGLKFKMNAGAMAKGQITMWGLKV